MGDDRAELPRKAIALQRFFNRFAHGRIGDFWVFAINLCIPLAELIQQLIFRHPSFTGLYQVVHEASHSPISFFGIHAVVHSGLLHLSYVYITKPLGNVKRAELQMISVVRRLAGRAFVAMVKPLCTIPLMQIYSAPPSASSVAGARRRRPRRPAKMRRKAGGREAWL